MFKRIRNLSKIINNVPYHLARVEKVVTEEKMISAKVLINSFNFSDGASINNFEFKVFSQWGDDGIIQYLIHSIDIPNKTFIEFGVENYTEANTRFLLMNDNWSGMIMDGSTANMNEVKNSDIYWKYDLTALDVFITAENINSIITGSGFHPEVGLLHIDIDGNDYWIWKKIDTISPIIVIVEYNSVFGDEHTWTVPYKPDFIRANEHHSNLYYGVSLASLCDLAEEKGYYFVGCNSAGNNAYFVRKDKINKLKPLSVREGYFYSRFKESRDANGFFSFVRSQERLSLIKGLPVFNTRSQQMEKI